MNRLHHFFSRRTMSPSSMPGVRIARQATAIHWRRLRQVFFLLACIACGYLLGSGFSVDQARKLERLKEKNAQRTVAVHRVRDENDALQEQLARAQVRIDMQEGMVNNLRATNEALQKRIDALHRDLAFYQRLATPQAAQGIQVQSLSVAKTTQDGVMQFHLVLLSNRMNDKTHRGTLRLSIAGHNKSGRQQTIELDDLDPRHRKVLGFSFSTIAELKGQWRLPAGFQPETIAVQVLEKGKEAIERRFRWEPREDA